MIEYIYKLFNANENELISFNTFSEFSEHPFLESKLKALYLKTFQPGNFRRD